jgi:hypothetical protein
MKTWRVLIFFGLPVCLLVGLTFLYYGTVRAGQGLSVTFMGRGLSEPDPSLLQTKVASGLTVQTNIYPVLMVEISNTTSKVYHLASNDGGSVWGEYRVRGPSGWTNWMLPLDPIHRAMPLKPHSRLSVCIRLVQVRGEQEFRIPCIPQSPLPRVPLWLNPILGRLQSLTLRPIWLPVTIPSDISSAQDGHTHTNPEPSRAVTR